MEDDTHDLDQVHDDMLWARRAQLLFSSLILFSMIANIICKKLYVYNTTKMFMWCCICYFFGMAIVLAYTDGIAADNKYTYNEQEKKSIIDVLQQMGISKRYFCGAQAFINLYFYDLGYFFAVLVTYNVFCVIKGNYRNFMKGVLKNKKIIGFLIFMLIMHSLPFIFIPIQQQNKNLYSYGPTGVKWLDGQNKTTNLLLYCGVSFSSNNEFWYLIALGLINMYICPLIMLIAHSILLWQNRKKIQIIKQQNYLNSKQQFIIVSGKISVIVFAIQFVNFVKLVLSLLPFKSNLYYWIIVIINFAFDLYPLLLLFFYLGYTKEKRGLQHGSSTILQQSFEEQ